MRKNIHYLLIILALGCYPVLSLAQANISNSANSTGRASQNTTLDVSAVQQRTIEESEICPNRFAIAFYKPNYVMPFYYTGSPYNKVYQNNTPGNESIKNTEMKYQFSFKVPLWKDIFHSFSSLYLAYTQLSYWQAYNHKAFFRETDFQPELFVANDINFRLYKELYLNFLNVGATHQSNGFGNNLERSWNRIYLEGIASTDNWMISIKPWWVIHDNSLSEHNPDIADYLGYGSITVAYKYCRQVFTLQTHSLFEYGGRRATGEFSWSFPLTPYINGYVQVFSGYGQSLIEYNHRTNSAGIGIALSNWV